MYLAKSMSIIISSVLHFQVPNKYASPPSYTKYSNHQPLFSQTLPISPPQNTKFCPLKNPSESSKLVHKRTMVLGRVCVGGGGGGSGVVHI